MFLLKYQEGDETVTSYARLSGQYLLSCLSYLKSHSSLKITISSQSSCTDMEQSDKTGKYQFLHAMPVSGAHSDRSSPSHLLCPRWMTNIMPVSSFSRKQFATLLETRPHVPTGSAGLLHPALPAKFLNMKITKFVSSGLIQPDTLGIMKHLC